MSARRRPWLGWMLACAIPAVAMGWLAWPDREAAAVAAIQRHYRVVFEGRLPTHVEVEARWFPRLIDEWLKPETTVERAARRLFGLLPPGRRTWIPRPMSYPERRVWSEMALINAPGRRAALPLLVARWPAVPSGQRGEVAKAIAMIVEPGDAALLPFVLGLADDADSDVRSAAADALKQFGPDHPEARAALARLASDQVSTVREHAETGWE